MPTRHTYTTFKAYIDSYVNTNGTRAITGAIMNTCLTDLAYSIYFGDFRSAKASAVTAGSNAITFASALPSADYSLIAEVTDASGNPIDYACDTDSFTVDGFTIVCAAAGRLNYCAIFKNT